MSGHKALALGDVESNLAVQCMCYEQVKSVRSVESVGTSLVCRRQQSCSVVGKALSL